MHTTDIRIKRDEFLVKLESLIKSTRQGSEIESIDRLRAGCDAFIYLNYKNGSQKVIDVSATSDIAVVKRVAEELMK